MIIQSKGTQHLILFAFNFGKNHKDELKLQTEQLVV